MELFLRTMGEKLSYESRNFCTVGDDAWLYAGSNEQAKQKHICFGRLFLFLCLNSDSISYKVIIFCINRMLYLSVFCESAHYLYVDEAFPH